MTKWIGESLNLVQNHAGCDDFVHFSVEVATGAIQALTPLVGVVSKLVPSSISGLRPYEMLFCMNIRDPSDFDVVSYQHSYLMPRLLNLLIYIILFLFFVFFV